MPSRVLGIDPGFGRCGVAVLEESKLLYSACITTNKKEAQEVRLLSISRELRSVIEAFKPQALAIEKLFFNQNASTALRVAEARGVILSEASRAGLRVYEYSPQDVKIAVTGYGKADKRQVEDMALKLLGLTVGPRYDDEADAMAVGITHLATRRAI